MEKVLQLVFKKADGSKKVFNVTDPRDDVTADEANSDGDSHCCRYFCSGRYRSD